MRSFHRVIAFAAAALAAGCGKGDLVLPGEGVAAKITIVGGNGQTGAVGSQLAAPIAVRVTDGTDRPVENQQVSFVVGANGGTVDPASGTTDSDGRLEARWTLGTTAGSLGVEARVVGGGAPVNLSASFEATATPAAPATLARVSGDGQNGTVGTALADPLVVVVADQYGNPVADVAVTWTAAGGGSVSAPVMPTGSDGRSAVQRTLGPTAGQQSASAAVDGLDGSPVGFTHTALVGTAGKLTITRQPSATAASGAAFAVQPQVQLRDQANNPVAQAGVAITARIASGPPGAALVGSPTVGTDAAGLATFNNLGVSGPAGQYFLNFSIPSQQNIAGVTSDLVAVVAGSAAKLAFVVQPANVAAGAAITPPVQVAVQDAQGNVVASATNAVTVALGANPAGGTLGGTKTVAAVNGVATFTGLSVDRAGSGYTLVATSASLQPATSAAFGVGVGGAAKLAIVTQPSGSAKSGQVFPQQPAVRLQDAQGNDVAQAGVTVTATIATGGGTLGGTPTATTDAQGVAAFTDLSISGSAGDRTLGFNGTGLTGVTSSAITIGAGTATAIALYDGDGQSARVGTAVPTDPSVKVTDTDGNGVAGVTVTFAVTNGGGSVTGASPTTGANGVATVGSWVLGPTAGAPNTLTATVNGLAGSPVTFTATALAGNANQLTIERQPSGARSGIAMLTQPQVQLRDAGGNPVATAGVGVTATIASSAGSASLTNATATTNSSGLATFSGLTLTGTAGGYTLAFGGSGLASTTSAQFTLSAGDPAKLAFVQPPSSTVQSGINFPQQPIVQVQDAQGNPVSESRTVTVSRTAGSGTLGGTATASTGGTSNAAFTNLRLTGDAGQYTLLFSSTGLIGVDVDLTVIAGAPAGAQSSLAVADASIQALTESTNLTVTVHDSSGNPVPGASVNLSATGSGNSFGSSPLTTGATGTATTTFASSSPGAKTISADITAPGGAITETANVTVTEIPTTTTITSDAPDPSVVGADVTVAVTVTATGAEPTGTVNVSGGGDTCTVTLSGGAGSCVLTPSSAGAATITASYPATGAFGASSDTEDHTVDAANVAPTAVDDPYTVDEDGTLTPNASQGVRANDTDDGPTSALIVSLVGGVSHGTLTLDPDGSFNYSPDPDYFGPDQFTYRVSDGALESNDATAAITVTAVNDAPSFTAGPSQTALPAEGWTGNVLGWATAISPGPGEAAQQVSFQVTTDNDLAFTTVPTVSEDGTLSYVAADPGASQVIVNVTVVLRDNGGGDDTSAPQQFTITIEPAGP